MAKIDELAAKVEELSALLARHGIESPVEAIPATDRPDYIPHGSIKHARLLGLVEVGKDDETVTLSTFTSPRSKRTFRLEDEMGALAHYPNIEPEKAIVLVLQQKVNELELAPAVPEDAPPMFRPTVVY